MNLSTEQLSVAAPSPTVRRNLTQATGCAVLDRTTLKEVRP
jgi:50S ribosomal subunit-associated GTPase HflX